MSKLKLLIVDDVPENLYAMEHLLADLDIELFKAESGNDALALTLHHDFAMILLDVQMPGMDGYEVATLLRSREKTAYIPIIFVTAINKNKAHVFQGYESGAVDYLFKPVDPDILRAKVGVFLQLHRQRMALEEKEIQLREANDQLTQNNKRLAEMYETANQFVKQQTTELQERNSALNEALSGLRSAESQLVLSEQMAVLGRLVAGIIHEVNSPLAAIASSTSLAEERISNWPNQAPQLTQWLQGPFGAMVSSMLDTAVRSSSTNITSLERRKRRSELNEQLETAGVAESYAISKVCAESRLLDNWEDDEWRDYLPLLQDPQAEQFLALLREVGSMRCCIDIIRMSADKAVKTIKAMKSYVHRKPSESLTKEDLTESIENILMLYGAALKQIEVVRESETIEPIECRANEIGQVWTNLLNNAINAMDQRGTLTIGIHHEEEHAVFSFGDTGSGIPEEIAPQVFKPFFTTKPAGEGSGLGLDIVQRIINEHHGTIDFESEIGRGTTFFIRLPYRQPREPATDTLATLPVNDDSLFEEVS